MTQKEWCGISFLFLVIFALSCITYYTMEIRISKVEIQLESLKSQLESAKKSNLELNTKIDQLRLEFDSYRQLTSDEFESTWDSFGRIRGNFMAIGYGYHLNPEDFAPEVSSEDFFPKEYED